MTQYEFPSIANYTILGPVGSGGFGQVFKATAADTGGVVAIKILSREDARALKLFYREAHILEQIDHPNVVRIIKHDLSSEPPYYVMEYCTGSLDEWMRQRRELDAVLTAILHAALGLKCLHDKGGFHRDIKPGNLLYSENQDSKTWTIKLADFGLARLPSAESTMTRNGAGTELYVAPELREGEPMREPCDIYSLGVTLTALLTGEPFPAKLRSQNIRGDVKHLVESMTSRIPEERPTVDDVVRQCKLIIQAMYSAPQNPPAANVKGSVNKAKPNPPSPLALLLLGGLAAMGLGLLTNLASENDYRDDE